MPDRHLLPLIHWPPSPETHRPRCAESSESGCVRCPLTVIEAAANSTLVVPSDETAISGSPRPCSIGDDCALRMARDLSHSRLGAEGLSWSLSCRLVFRTPPLTG